MADHITSTLEDLSIYPDPIPLTRLLQILSNLDVSQVSKPNEAKTILFPSSVLRYLRAVDNLHKLEFVIRGIFKNGRCNIKDWWKILVIVFVMIKNHPNLEEEILSVLTRVVFTAFKIRPF